MGPDHEITAYNKLYRASTKDWQVKDGVNATNNLPLVGQITQGINPDLSESDNEDKLNKIHELEMKILSVRMGKVKAMEQGGELDKEV